MHLPILSDILGLVRLVPSIVNYIGLLDLLIKGHVMDKPEIIPLLIIQDEAFRRQYELGVWYALSDDRQEHLPPLDSYLVVNLKYAAACGDFTPLQAHKLHRFGFCLGIYHGVILSADATNLLTFSHEESQRGYLCGRRAYLNELSHQERTYTDEKVIRLFAQIMEENPQVLNGEDDAILYWCIGDFLGILSGQLFPLTEEEQVN